MSKANLLNRRQVVSTLLADRGDAIVVGGLGASTTTSPPLATMPAISISGVLWVVRS